MPGLGSEELRGRGVEWLRTKRRRTQQHLMRSIGWFGLIASCWVGLASAVKPLPASSVEPTFAELSNLRGRSRNIVIVTTASMPWMTGTSVNPLLRAVYLEKRKEKHSVSLCVPWIENRQDQAKLFNGNVFKESTQQANWIRNWVKKNLGIVTEMKILFYEGKYLPEFGSIFPMGDVTHSIPEHERDVAILEEPEHLTWYHMGNKWCDVFNFVVGVVHTNYFNYAINDHQVALPARLFRAGVLTTLNGWCCRAYCHRIIKLSDAVPTYPNSITCNIHGVRSNFIDIGTSKIRTSVLGYPRFSKGAYFIGKALWSKGYRQLLIQLKAHWKKTGVNLHMNVYGSGPDEHLIKQEVEREGLDWIFNGPIDHANPVLHDYKVMINPSLSDVVCTTTAEALAMGKFVVCADHPSNEFFKTFRNCFVYSNPKEFTLCLKHAMAADPAPLTENDRYRLSWHAATERLYDASYVGSQRQAQNRVDKTLADLHNKLASWDVMRHPQVLGRTLDAYIWNHHEAVPNTRTPSPPGVAAEHMPESRRAESRSRVLTQWAPKKDVKGMVMLGLSFLSVGWMTVSNSPSPILDTPLLSPMRNLRT